MPTTVGVNVVGAATTTFRGFGTSVNVVPDCDRCRPVPAADRSGNFEHQLEQHGRRDPRAERQPRADAGQLREGQTIVLGGLFGRKEQASNTRIPLLGEIPLVGELLFHTKRATEDENELIMLATPEIVRAMDAEQVPPLPGHYVTHPDRLRVLQVQPHRRESDLGHYQLLPFGNGQGPAHDVGHNFYNPSQLTIS